MDIAPMARWMVGAEQTSKEHCMKL